MRLGPCEHRHETSVAAALSAGAFVAELIAGCPAGMPLDAQAVLTEHPELVNHKSALLELAYSSASDALLTPITDALGWKDRMNTPGTVGAHNWTFRLPWTLDELFSAADPVATARELAHLAERYGRKR